MYLVVVVVVVVVVMRIMLDYVLYDVMTQRLVGPNVGSTLPTFFVPE